jgi:hypothetical protein
MPAELIESRYDQLEIALGRFGSQTYKVIENSSAQCLIPMLA